MSRLPQIPALRRGRPYESLDKFVGNAVFSSQAGNLVNQDLFDFTETRKFLRPDQSFPFAFVGTAGDGFLTHFEDIIAFGVRVCPQFGNLAIRFLFLS